MNSSTKAMGAGHSKVKIAENLQYENGTKQWQKKCGVTSQRESRVDMSTTDQEVKKRYTCMFVLS